VTATTTLRKSRRSTVYLPVAWLANVDLGLQLVRVALVPVTRDVVDGDWKTAGWAGDAATRLPPPDSRYRRVARLLIGPGPGAAINPDRARWGIWSDVDDNPENPVLTPDDLGYLLVY
jgi:hypothetical protein